MKRAELDEFLDEVESALRAAAPRKLPDPPWDPANYIGGGQSKLTYLGYRVPVLRGLAKRGFSFSKREPAEVAEIWHHVWTRSEFYEVMSLALLWFSTKAAMPYLDRLKQWANRIDNWAHADELSGLYADMLEESPQKIWPLLQEWNRAKDAWLIRLSIVSLFHYARLRTQQPKAAWVEAHLKPHLRHPDHYVQKAIGWCLREYRTAHPARARIFLQKHLNDISGTAFAAAVEKIPAAEKAKLKKMRASYRAAAN